MLQAAAWELGSAWWPLAAFRELDDALCHLRVNEDTIGMVLLKTAGAIDAVVAVDAFLEAHADDWFVAEVRGQILQAKKTHSRAIFDAASCAAAVDIVYGAYVIPRAAQRARKGPAHSARADYTDPLLHHPFISISSV